MRIRPRLASILDSVRGSAFARAYEISWDLVAIEGACGVFIQFYGDVNDQIHNLDVAAEICSSCACT